MLIKGSVIAEWFAFINDDEQYLQVSKRGACINIDVDYVQFSIDHLPDIDINDVIVLVAEWFGDIPHFLKAVASRC